MRSYIKRFINAAALGETFAMQEVLVNALTQRLQDGDSFRSLFKKPTCNFDDLLSQAEMKHKR